MIKQLHDDMLYVEDYSCDLPEVDFRCHTHDRGETILLSDDQRTFKHQLEQHLFASCDFEVNKLFSGENQCYNPNLFSCQFKQPSATSNKYTEMSMCFTVKSMHCMYFEKWDEMT